MLQMIRIFILSTKNFRIKKIIKNIEKKIIKNIKIAIKIIGGGSKEDIYLEIKKTIGIFEEGEIYEIHINNIEEVNEKFVE